MSSTRITDLFDSSLAKMLAEKIVPHNQSFDAHGFIAEIDAATRDRTYTQRVGIIAEALARHLPPAYPDAIQVLGKILGPENPSETGMFREFYWLLPVGKFVEVYGHDHFDESLSMIEEITKRNTGEYAIRPYIRANPDETLRRMENWARSENFHLRRLASEGLRPKLPWAAKLDVFIKEPEPVFAILEMLKEDPVRFVQRSVANHLTDYLKVNPDSVRPVIDRWGSSDHPSTAWIVRHATRKVS